jgi:hypothetical protein
MALEAFTPILLGEDTSSTARDGSLFLASTFTSTGVAFPMGAMGMEILDLLDWLDENLPIL